MIGFAVERVDPIYDGSDRSTIRKKLIFFSCAGYRAVYNKSMTNTEKNNIANLLAELTSMMVAQDMYRVACFSDDLCRASSSVEARPHVDALITLAQGFLGGYAWSEADIEAAETLLEDIAA